MEYITEHIGDELECEVVRLHEALSGSLLRYALTITQDRGLAEDSVQECFLRYFLARRRGTAVLSERAWLFRVMRNLLLDAAKRAGVDRLLSLGEDGVQPAWRPVSEGDARQGELIPALRALLTAREFECLQLRLEGLRYREIAAVLGVRTGTVGAMLARALKKVQKNLGQEADQAC